MLIRLLSVVNTDNLKIIDILLSIYYDLLSTQYIGKLIFKIE